VVTVGSAEDVLVDGADELVLDGASATAVVVVSSMSSVLLRRVVAFPCCVWCSLQSANATKKDRPTALVRAISAVLFRASFCREAA